jgi:hypothetical protein
LKDSNVSLKVKIMKEEGIRVRSLTCSTSKVRNACRSFKMGTKTNDKWVNYSYGLTQIKQQIDKCIIITFLVHGQATSIHIFTRFTTIQI